MSDNGGEKYRLSLAEKARGAFLALAAGDALGWPQEIPRNVARDCTRRDPHEEFREWKRLVGGSRFRLYEETVHAGDYSDDTQLALAVARSRIDHGLNWWKAFTLKELPFWTLYERGGGGATKRAVRAWSGGSPPWRVKNGGNIRSYFAAGGNGAAMRVLPHALFFARRQDSSDLVRDVVLDGLATHGHPRALVGAAAYAYAAWRLVRNRDTLRFGELLEMLMDEEREWADFPETVREESTWFKAANKAMNGHYEETWKETIQEMIGLLDTARREVSAGALADDSSVLEKLGCLGREKGSGTRSVAAAVYLSARHAALPKQGVLRAAFEKGTDTDTLAAMTGGLMGCLAGTEWIPMSWLKVQDAEYIQRVADLLISESGDEPHPDAEILPNHRSILSRLEALKEDEQGALDLGGGKQATVKVLSDMKSLGKSTAVRGWRLRTCEGQTLYLRKVSKKVSTQGSPARTYDGTLPFHSETSRSAAGKSDYPRKPELYSLFCKELSLFVGNSSRQIKPLDVQNRLELERNQVQAWLDRAEQDGLIRKTKKRPVTYELCQV